MNETDNTKDKEKHDSFFFFLIQTIFLLWDQIELIESIQLNELNDLNELIIW